MKYLNEVQRVRLMTSTGRPSGARYTNIFTEEEASEHFSPVMFEAKGILSAQQNLLKIKANFNFAVVDSDCPFQVMQICTDDFAIFIDYQAFFWLISLCFRLQSLPPLANLISTKSIPNEIDYSGKYLLDITKDMVFNPVDLGKLDIDNQITYVYQAALNYILGHEIAHVSHGHIEFKMSSDFVQFQDSKENINFTLKTLEMDADSSATTSVCNVFETIINHKVNKKEIPNNLSESDYRKYFRTIYILGIYVAQIFQDTLATDYSPSAYPTGYSRFLNAKEILLEFYRRHYPEALALPDEVRDALVQCFTKLSGDIGNLHYPMAANIYYLDSDGPHHIYDSLGELKGLSPIVPLLGRWARIRPLLEKYQRGGILAAATVAPI